MSIDRRGFIKSAGLASLAVGAAAGQVRGQEDVVLKLSSQEGRIPGESLREKVQRMAEWGFVGIEPHGGGLGNRVEEYQQALEGTPVSVSAVCAGYEGCIISHDEAERQKAIDTIKTLLDAVGAIGSTGLIVVPAFHGQTELSSQEARPILIDNLREVGEHAASVGTCVLLEPLNRGECYFLRQLADAAAICRDVDSEGVRMMGDFYHMGIEETSDRGAFISAGEYLRHVHLASRRRVLPGQDERSFVDGFRGLKEIGFTEYCSRECGCDGDPMEEIPKSVAFLNQQWAEA